MSVLRTQKPRPLPRAKRLFHTDAKPQPPPSSRSRHLYFFDRICPVMDRLISMAASDKRNPFIHTRMVNTLSMCFAGGLFLLVADRKSNTIYQVALNNGKARAIVKHSTAKRPVAVAYDRTSYYVYLSLIHI